VIEQDRAIAACDALCICPDRVLTCGHRPTIVRADERCGRTSTWSDRSAPRRHADGAAWITQVPEHIDDRDQNGQVALAVPVVRSRGGSCWR